MKYYEQTNNDYIEIVGTDIGGTEISEERYNTIKRLIINSPVEEGYYFKLNKNLTYEKIKEKTELEEENVKGLLFK